jgi:hypothetical protein
MTNEAKQDALRRAIVDLPKKLRTEWYVVGAPWGQGDWVIAGHNDPHCGLPVCDCEDFDGEQPHALEIAAYIAEANPAAVGALLFQIASLQAQVEALRADAERYRWLRAEDPAAHQFLLVLVHDKRIVEETFDKEIDAAIDASRSTEGEQRG